MKNQSERKRTTVIPRAQDNRPTPERAAKGDYTDVIGDGREVLQSGFRQAGAAVRKNPPIDRMVKTGQINAVQYHDALRWRQEAEKAYAGVVEHSSDFINVDDVRHDPMTWRIMCMESGIWLGEIRERIGRRADWILRMLLIGEMSFLGVGLKLYPDAKRSVAATRAQALSVAAVERLSEVMGEQRKATARAKRDAEDWEQRRAKWKAQLEEKAQTSCALPVNVRQIA